MSDSSISNTAINRKLQAKWTADDRTLMLSALKEQKNNGNHANGSWKPKTWNVVADLLRGTESPGTAVKSHSQVISYWFQLLSEYKNVAYLKTLSGAGWDEETCRVTFPDNVWDNIILKDSKFKKYRTRGFPVFHEMADLVSGYVATGEKVFAPGSSRQAVTSSSSVPEGPSQRKRRRAASPDLDDDDLIEETEKATSSHYGGSLSDSGSESEVVPVSQSKNKGKAKQVDSSSDSEGGNLMATVKGRHSASTNTKFKKPKFNTPIDRHGQLVSEALRALGESMEAANNLDHSALLASLTSPGTRAKNAFFELIKKVQPPLTDAEKFICVTVLGDNPKVVRDFCAFNNSFLSIRDRYLRGVIEQYKQAQDEAYATFASGEQEWDGASDLVQASVLATAAANDAASSSNFRFD